jgi:hypothetical protein
MCNIDSIKVFISSYDQRFGRIYQPSDIYENATVLSLSFHDSYHGANREHKKLLNSVLSLADTYCSPAVQAICDKVF